MKIHACHGMAWSESGTVKLQLQLANKYTQQKPVLLNTMASHLRAPFRALSPPRERQSFENGARLRDASQLHYDIAKFSSVC